MAELEVVQPTIDELLVGLQHPSYSSQRLLLLDLLINRTADVVATETTASADEPSTTCPSALLTNLFDLMLGMADTAGEIAKAVYERNDARQLEAGNLVDKCMGVLINCTVSEANCEVFLTRLDKTPQSRQFFDRSLQRFLQHNPQAEPGSVVPPAQCNGAAPIDDWRDIDEWQSFGSVLCNMCQLDAGRKILISGPQAKDHVSALVTQVKATQFVADSCLENSYAGCCTSNVITASCLCYSFLERLIEAYALCLKQIRSHNAVRRKGAVGCIRR